MLTESYRVLDQLRQKHGLYVASPSEAYRYIWIRDCVFMSLPYLDKPDERYEQVYHRIFDLLKEYEWKLDILCKQKPTYEWEYLHARYSAVGVKEIHDQPWGHVQHDMVGALLYGIGKGMAAGKRILRDDKDRTLVQKLVSYLQNVEYWHDPDNGMWEETRELHASSVGACVAGLTAVKELVFVPDELIRKGMETTLELFPRESVDKEADMAQLSLVYPYRLFTGPFGEMLVSRVERQLLRERGVIRYGGDSYYSTLEAAHGRKQPREFYSGTEAEWTMGLPWLALCRIELGDVDKAEGYIDKTEQVMLRPGVLPELYYSGTSNPNPNTPLGWSSAMYILAKEAWLHALRSKQKLKISL